MAFRVRCVLRPEDLVARLGGDEFSVLCSVSSREEALVIPGRLLEAMSSPFSLDAHSIRASFSARVAVSASPSADSAELLRQADSAMYRAKHSGSTRVALFRDEERRSVMTGPGGLCGRVPSARVGSMPILAPGHDFAHQVESDTAWSESYYFNAYDPVSDSGFFTRIGVRPNEGTMDVGLSVWLPGGELAEYRHVVDQHEMVGSPLVVGGVRYELLDAMKSWRIVADVDAVARTCHPSNGEPQPVHLAVDVRFDAVSPAVGTDGQQTGGPRSDQASAATGTTGKGHLEQAGRWTGSVTIDGVAHTWNGAHGNRDRSWGPRRWGGPPMWRWFSINIGESMHFGGIRLGTAAGDLHRGWVFEDGRVTSIKEWQLRTELAADGLTQRVVHAVVVDKLDRAYRLTGEVLRVADIGKSGGTMINEGLTRWTYRADDGSTVPGYGIAEYLHQVDDHGRPAVPVE